MARNRFNQKLPIGITIRESRSLPAGALGSYDERTNVLTVAANLPRTGKHITLLHELLHAVDMQLVAIGATKRRVGEKWIESAAPNLFIALLVAGFWKGPRVSEGVRFYAGLKSPGRQKGWRKQGGGK